ncbi:MAG: hypothetical protein ACT4ON_00025 [Bacteroidota bacterium]
MKNNQKNSAKFSIDNLNNINKLNKDQMLSLVGGQCANVNNSPITGIVVVPDVCI